MIYLAADHRGFHAKQKIKEFLESLNHTVTDLGPHNYDKDDDYPDYAFLLGEKVAKENSKGIIICSSGIGVCIAANKVKGIRAGYCESEKHAVSSRGDDNTNILVLDEMTFDTDSDFKIITAWLNTPFSGEERHKRRLEKISAYEEEHSK